MSVKMVCVNQEKKSHISVGRVKGKSTARCRDDF